MRRSEARQRLAAEPEIFTSIITIAATTTIASSNSTNVNARRFIRTIAQYLATRHVNLRTSLPPRFDMMTCTSLASPRTVAEGALLNRKRMR